MISHLTVLNDKSLTGKAAHWGKHHQTDGFSFPRDCWPREEGEEGVFEMLVRCFILLNHSYFLHFCKNIWYNIILSPWQHSNEKKKAQVTALKILCLSLLNSVSAELEVQMVSFYFFPKLKPAKLRVQRSVFSHCTCWWAKHLHCAGKVILHHPFSAKKYILVLLRKCFTQILAREKKCLIFKREITFHSFVVFVCCTIECLFIKHKAHFLRLVE